MHDAILKDDKVPVLTGFDALNRVITESLVTPVFQPIVDLFSGSPIGYEMLSRGPVPFENPEILFESAKGFGLSWDIERTCRRSALKKISELPPEFRHSMFFLNVSPYIFNDPRFVEGFTIALLNKYGLQPGSIVLEITEKESILDYAFFEKLIRHYEGQGFNIAIDDFGSGHSGLVTLINSRPHFLKLDMAVVRDIHRLHYKQQLVKSLLLFSSSVDSKMIAEGVETWEELEALVRLGVRYAQGYLFAKPAPEPPELNKDTKKKLQLVLRKFNYCKTELDEAIGGMAIRGLSCEKGSRNNEQINNMFLKNPAVDHVVIVEDERPVGLITKQYFFSKTSGPFGYVLSQKKDAELAMKQNMLVVGNTTPITTLSRLAMDRLPDDLYDPVVVRDPQGSFFGTVTMKQLITKSTELEVKTALGTNPLSNLPGNQAIQKYIQEALNSPEYTVVYADLDHFKEYNDAYGFLMGDEMIRLTARVILTGANALCEDAEVGHIGGDDFVVVCKSAVLPDALQTVCDAFDRERISLFECKDVDRCYFYSFDRKGRRAAVPLTTLSLAVITSDNLGQRPHPAMLSQAAASLKKRVKEVTQKSKSSGFLIEQRTYREA